MYRVRYGKYRACPRIQQPGYGKSSDAGELPEGLPREVTFCFRHDVCEVRPHAAPFGAYKTFSWRNDHAVDHCGDPADPVGAGLVCGHRGELDPILLVIAIIVVLVRVIQGRRPI